MVVDVGHGEQPIEVSFWTLLVYEEEFAGADLITDLFGAEVVPWSRWVKALWACLKSADDAIPPIKEWARSITEANLPEVRQAVVPAIMQALFRTRTTTDE